MVFLYSRPVLVQGEFCRGGNIDLGTVETEVGSVCRKFAVLKVLTKMSVNDMGDDHHETSTLLLLLAASCFP